MVHEERRRRHPPRAAGSTLALPGVMQRVLLVVVDGCTPRVLGPAIDRGELPLLADLAARGTLILDCLSIFPSITPFLRGFLLQLNGERLRAPTLFQLVERENRRAACFNHLVFRDDVPHDVSPPLLLLRLLPSVGQPGDGPWPVLALSLPAGAGRGTSNRMSPRASSTSPSSVWSRSGCATLRRSAWAPLIDNPHAAALTQSSVPATPARPRHHEDRESFSCKSQQPRSAFGGAIRARRNGPETALASDVGA